MSVFRREIGTEGWEELTGSGTGRVMEVILGLSCGNEWNDVTICSVKKFLERAWVQRQSESRRLGLL